MTDQPTDRPGVVAAPPLIYLVPLLLGLLADWLFPIDFLPIILQVSLGLPLIAMGIFLALWAFRSFRRAGTSVDIRKPTRVVVVGGPYRFSRNPMYLSLTLEYAGVAVLTDALWSILLLPVALLVTQYGVIVREERYLERKFGEEYLHYKRSVRRWS